MKNGNWIPIDKKFIHDLPHNRPYTELEAMFSLTVDYDNNKEITVMGYADLWQWSRKKVAFFFERIGIEVEYPEITSGKRNQKGHIKVHKKNIKGTYKEHKRFIEFNNLDEQKNIKGTYKEHKKNISGDTTRDPSIEPMIIEPKDNPPNPLKSVSKKSFEPPTEQEVVKYFTENGYSADAGKKAFMYYDTAGWKDSKGNQVRSWKQKMIAVWFKDENKSVERKVEDEWSEFRRQHPEAFEVVQDNPRQ